jgi:hypothetical protein
MDAPPPVGWRRTRAEFSLLGHVGGWRALLSDDGTAVPLALPQQKIQAA